MKKPSPYGPGNKRAIDIFANGAYICTTRWANTCKQAIDKFTAIYRPDYIGQKITANYKP